MLAGYHPNYHKSYFCAMNTIKITIMIRTYRRLVFRQIHTDGMK